MSVPTLAAADRKWVQDKTGQDIGIGHRTGLGTGQQGTWYYRTGDRTYDRTGQGTEDRGQGTGDSGQRTRDRGQRTEDRTGQDS